MAATSDTNDLNWVKRAFLLPETSAVKARANKISYRYATSAGFKFTNAKLGNSFAINPPPQFTRWCDIRVPPRGMGHDEWVNGQGVYYSEAIDDNAQEVHMTFGQPRFNTWATFFINYYDPVAAILANKGTVSPFWLNAGDILGFIFSLPLQPFIYGCRLLSNFMSFMNNDGGSKWWYFKPTMHNYWSAVNYIANGLLVNMGLAPRLHESKYGQKLNDEHAPKPADAAKMLHDYLPNIFMKDGGMDVMALSANAQRRADIAKDRMIKKREQTLQRFSNWSLGLTEQEMSQFQLALLEEAQTAVEEYPDAQWPTTKDLFNEFARTPDGKWSNEGAAADSSGNWDIQDGATKNTSSQSNVLDQVATASETAVAMQRDGVQFVTFRVNNTGPASESFSNSVRDGDLAGRINATAGQARNLRFDLMEGQAMPGVQSVVNAVGSLVAGAANSVGLAGLSPLAGNAFIDVPKIYENSSMQLPRANYTVQIILPYGNKISKALSLVPPLACLLAAVLPLSAGRSAYTNPFYCQLYHQGHCQIKNGMVTAMNIRRATGNVGWNADHEALNFEVDFEVTDLSNMMHMPIRPGFTSRTIREALFTKGVNAASQATTGQVGTTAQVITGEAFDEESVFQDYLAVLGSLSPSDMIYRMRRMDLVMTQNNIAYRSWQSTNNFLHWSLDMGVARSLAMFAQATNRFDQH